MTGQAALDALQRTLAAEHAAVFVYGALGARTSESRSPVAYARLTDAYLVHQQRRDDVLELVRDAGAAPVAAEPGYRLGELADATELDARALDLERSCAATYAYLVANSTGSVRRFAIEALLDAGVRGLAFGGRPETLPGL
ncbi:DUF4439 domain-containing protein [Nocardioides sp. GY 10113]|uniref:ferritin-like domain-containing protein n=1 Tax=Nocardioides sp. GY 10113 TaxID=2569761 RepID=UPI0010A7EB78|nr:ferritin-like domain-containing protein [Nocardioides sp. GY 10113]TIC88736.1 DUF4439 domain-containing protein [Nocardioides sp. GY 10113]